MIVIRLRKVLYRKDFQSVRIMCVVYVVRQYPLSSSRLCPLPWEFAERKCNFWLVPSWPASMAQQHGEKTIFKETMPGATRSFAPSHGKYSGLFRRNCDTRGISSYSECSTKEIQAIIKDDLKLHKIL